MLSRCVWLVNLGRSIGAAGIVTKGGARPAYTLRSSGLIEVLRLEKEGGAGIRSHHHIGEREDMKQ